MVKESPQRQVGQYYLMEKIAQGGMAEIFKGLSYDVHGLKKTVCIKKILSHVAASAEFIDSLIDEAKIAVNLVHGNIAQTYDLGKVGDDYFMVMEFVDGKSLSQIHKRCLSRGELIPLQYLIYFISEVLNGLNYIHRRADENGLPLHIVHRDMSPQNVMVSYSGTVKIIDFGIAKTGFKIGSTDSGILKGKFAYMSPEQAYGDTIDHRSDIFSVGIILHEMLTGKRLFKASDSRETIRNVRRSKVDAPSIIRPDIPDELDRIAMKALSKDRRRRYGQASEMHDDLIKFLYSNFPNFKPSDAAAFVQDMFKDEFLNPRKIETDVKTPYLIIDRTNSALADESQFEVTGRTKAPVDLREYMLDEESATSSNEAEEEAGIEDQDISEEEMPAASKGMQRLKALRRRMIISVSVTAILLIGLTSFFALRHFKAGSAKEEGAALAEVMVVSSPSDAEVFLDDLAHGKGSPVIMRNIETKKDHVLSVRKDGYIPHERHLSLKPGEFLSISIALTRKTLPTASIEIVTTPPGATVFIDDKETSLRTPAKMENLEAEKGHHVGLFLSGHRFWSKKLALKPGETKSFDIQLTKDFGSMSVASDPDGSLVMLDGIPIGQAPLEKDNLEPGRIYKVEVWQKGYQTMTREIKAKAGQREDVRFVLTKEPTPAEIEAQSRKKADGEKGP